jgi:hypothetical protein
VSEGERRWYDYKGGLVLLPSDAPLTSWSRLDCRTHAIHGDGLGPHTYQMVTRCGKRACPASGHEVPGPAKVDCPDCLAD